MYTDASSKQCKYKCKPDQKRRSHQYIPLLMMKMYLLMANNVSLLSFLFHVRSPTALCKNNADENREKQLDLSPQPN